MIQPRINLQQDIGRARSGRVMAARVKKKSTPKKKKAKRDACYDKVKRAYTKNGGTWPSAYGSGALVRCRKVGAKNWGKKSGGTKKT